MSSYEKCYNCGADDGIDVDKRKCTECGAYWTLITKKAHGDVLDERFRQTSKEGWTPEHDDAHPYSEMAKAAACYAAIENPNHTLRLHYGKYDEPVWPEDWTYKPKDRRRNLVRAAALIIAEIERLDRAEQPTTPGISEGEKHEEA